MNSTDTWPGVREAVEALEAAFGTAYVEHTGGGCHSIIVPVDGAGYLMVGDPEGPLGDTGDGFGVELVDGDGAWVRQVMRCGRDPQALVEGLRAYLADGTRTGLTTHDLLVERREEHHTATGHLVNAQYVTDENCAECRAIRGGFQRPDEEAR